jgi:hypothetical protein
LIEGAKKEGEVILYASMNLEEANAVIQRFEGKYPFLKVKLNRTMALLRFVTRLF